MAIDIYSPQFMLKAVEAIKPQPSFLRDRYFKDGMTFPTEEVLIEYREGAQRIAPFINPRRGGITSYREGYQTERYAAPMIGEKRSLTIDDLNKKGFGENLFSGKLASQRAAEILARDLKEMQDAILLREEQMAAQCILNNAIVGTVYGGEIGDKANSTDWEISYFEGGENPATYTPGGAWTTSYGGILDDLYNMCHDLNRRGLPAIDFVCAPNVAAVMMKNEEIRKLLDNRRFEMGEVKPKQAGFEAVWHGVLNANGFELNIYSYAGQYKDEAGVMTPFIPNGYGFVSAPGAGEVLYGAITQMEQADGQFHTYANKVVPRRIQNAEANTQYIELASRPLMKPERKNPWISAQLIK